MCLTTDWWFCTMYLILLFCVIYCYVTLCYVILCFELFCSSSPPHAGTHSCTLHSCSHFNFSVAYISEARAHYTSPWKTGPFYEQRNLNDGYWMWRKRTWLQVLSIESTLNALMFRPTSCGEQTMDLPLGLIASSLTSHLSRGRFFTSPTPQPRRWSKLTSRMSWSKLKFMLYVTFFCSSICPWFGTFSIIYFQNKYFLLIQVINF